MNSNDTDITSDVENIYNNAKVSVAKLRMLGITNLSVMNDLRSASIALKSDNFESAYIFASRAKNDADAIKELYRDTCIALASAGECIIDARDNGKNIDRSLDLLRTARKSFEETDFQQALQFAMESCAETLKESSQNIMTKPIGSGPVSRACSWQYINPEKRSSICFNILSKEYKKGCTGELICRSDIKG